MKIWRHIARAAQRRPWRGFAALLVALALLSAPPKGWMAQPEGAGLVICTGAGPLVIDDPFAPTPHEERAAAPCLTAAMVALAAPAPPALAGPRLAPPPPFAALAMVGARPPSRPPARGPPRLV